MAKKDKTDRLPYPTARITRQLRGEIKDKMISSKVKMATNQFLGDLTEIVGEDMNTFSDKTIRMDAFEKASRPYTYANRLKEEEKEVVEQLEKVRTRMEKVIRDFRTKFEIVDENEFKVGHDELPVSEPENKDKEDKPKTIGEMTIEEMDV
ncbi:MAG: hypothetical protein U9Q92_06695 [archaeon]|nr:hypothetical protein [archaeon]